MKRCIDFSVISDHETALSNGKKPEVTGDPVDLVREAFREFVAELLSGSSQVEVFDPKIRAQTHAFVQKHLEAWRVSHRCIVNGCGAQAIQNSHTIQKRGPLQGIADNGFVLTPRTRTGQYGLAMRSVPIATASTFPGFCSRHERLFSDFEQRRQLRNEKDFILQAYRATCREVVRLQIEHAYFKENSHLFRENHDELVASELAKRIRAKGKNITSKDIRPLLDRSDRIGADPLDLLLQTARGDLQKLQREHLKAMEDALFGQSKTDVPVAVVSLPIEIPVCLSGMDCINLPIGDQSRRVLVILNVIPEPGITYIVAYLSPEDRDLLLPYVERIDGLFPGINMIEAAMLHSTDHWFLRPSVWRKIPKKRQNQILSEIMLRDASTVQGTMHSIFDELRTELLNRLETINPESVSTEIMQMVLARERRKLADVDAEAFWMSS